MRGGKRQDKAVNEAKGNPGGRKPGKSRAKTAVQTIEYPIAAKPERVTAIIAAHWLIML